MSSDASATGDGAEALDAASEVAARDLGPSDAPRQEDGRADGTPEDDLGNGGDLAAGDGGDDLQPRDLGQSEDAGAEDAPTSDTATRDLGGEDGGVVLPPSGCEALSPLVLSDPTVVSTEEALREALAAGGSILLDNDITVTAPLSVETAVSLDGGGYTLSGGGTTHLFIVTLTDFTIQNVTLCDAVNQVPDEEHFSRRSGAAIMATGFDFEGPNRGSLTVIDVTFEGNRAPETSRGEVRGGAVYLFNLPDATFSGVTFSDNAASNGGAIGGLGSSLRVIDTIFENNFTNAPEVADDLEGMGGAISLDAMTQNGTTSYFHICGSAFRGNRALRLGGAIYYVSHWYTGTDVIIDRTTFDDNATTSGAQGQGGAIFAMDDNKHEMPGSPQANSLLVSNTLFVDNQTWGQGGGLWFWTEEGRLTLVNTTFTRNSTGDSHGLGMGGGLAVSHGAADIINSTFAFNHALFHGGGIQIGDATVSLANTLFVDNTSAREGGWANFHTNQPAQIDAGGNMQYLTAELEIDSNSNKPVSSESIFEDPDLQALSDNGGPTWTMALGPDSPAINRGVVDDAPESDQRGEPRDSTPDIGAYEAQ